MPYITLGSPTLFLASLCLTAFVGNSARATLLPSEHRGVPLSSGNPAHSFQLPGFLLPDNIPSWNSAGDSTPTMEFDLLGCSTAGDVPLVGNQIPEVSGLSQFLVAEPVRQDEESPAKAIYLATQRLASDLAAAESIKFPSQSLNSQGSSSRPKSQSASWVARVANSAYSVLALLALGAFGIVVFRWNQRRQEFQNFQRFSSITDSDLAMARLSNARPPGSWTEVESRGLSPAHSSPPASHTK